MKHPILPLLAICFLTSSLSAQTGQPRLKLTGIINLPGYKCVLVEERDSNPGFRQTSHHLLQEGERVAWLEVGRIDPGNGTVKMNLEVEKTNATVTLKLYTEANPLATNRANDQPGIQLHDADLEHILLLYGEVSKRTLLRPTLAPSRFTLQASASNRVEATLVLANALNRKGITNIPDGNKFIMILPTEKASMAVPRSAQIAAPLEQSESRSSTPAVTIPAGQINFPNVDFGSTYIFYVELAYRNRQRDPSAPLPPSSENIHFRTQTPLTRAEAIYAFDTLFSWQNIKVVPSGTSLVKAVQIVPK
jgi:hypothetical protein